MVFFFFFYKKKKNEINNNNKRESGGKKKKKIVFRFTWTRIVTLKEFFYFRVIGFLLALRSRGCLYYFSELLAKNYFVFLYFCLFVINLLFLSDYYIHMGMESLCFADEPPALIEGSLSSGSATQHYHLLQKRVVCVRKGFSDFRLEAPSPMQVIL